MHVYRSAKSAVSKKNVLLKSNLPTDKRKPTSFVYLGQIRKKAQDFFPVLCEVFTN